MTDQIDTSLVNPDLLPPQVREFVRVIGLPETIKLLDARRGLPLTIPTNHDCSTALRGVISDASIAALAASPLAGKHYRDMPAAVKILKQIRNVAIVNSEASLSELSREYQLSRQHIINIRKSTPDNSQLDLFGEHA